ncbi:DUF6240 domain-containing protein [Alkalithermobacter paradoxus]|uniref:Flagellar hook-length control protein FliK n=1 Tax=Alkalithermobacter paradoxus TaxID=29349 RepID=A0A1V4I7T9_9FIRM|nr:hypothetical protein CLOTH_12190 [[Clostridium] thermoalcaliphilum]
MDAKALEVSSYIVANEAYSSFKSTHKIKGTLIEKNEDEIKIDIGDNRVIEAKLREEIECDKGDTVLIDKKNIVSSRIIKKYDTVIEKEDKEKYEAVLNHLDIEVNNDNLNAAKALDINNIKITKENITSFVMSKECLDKICVNLDYDTAIKIIEKEIDIENDSLYKISLAIDEVKNEKNGFSFMKLFKKKEISTDEAEYIAKKIYGSPMGKDITDIIKVLYKKDISITKKNIEKINDTFYKLDKIKDIDNSTFVDVLKNKLEATIDNIYKLKNYVRKSEIKVKGAEAKILTRAYENINMTPVKVTEKQLKLLEEDIKTLLNDIEIDATTENINISKEFIKNNIEINTVNIKEIHTMKQALKELVSNFDSEKAAALVSSGLDIEKTDIRQLVEKINTENKEQNVDTKETINKDDTNGIESILKKIESLQKVTDKELLVLIKKNIDFNIDKINIVINSKENTDQVQSIDKAINSNIELNAIVKMKSTLESLKNLDLNTVAFQIKNKLPMTLSSLESSHKLITNNIQSTELQMPKKLDNNKALDLYKYINKNINSIYEDKKIDIKSTFESVKALMQNSLNINKVNISKIQQVYGYFNNIKENISSNMVIDTMKSNIDIYNIDIENVSQYIDSYKVKESNETEGLKHEKYKTSDNTLIPNMKLENKEKENIISLLMKNNIPIVMKNIKSAYMLLRNKEQIGHNIGDIVELLKEESSTRLQNICKEISSDVKHGTIDIENVYEEIEKEIKNIKTYELDSKSETLVSKKIDQIEEGMKFQTNLNKSGDLFQLPIYMNNVLSNLQVYIRDQKSKNGKINKENVSVAMNLDTQTLGNLNIYMDINKKNINLRIGLESDKYKSSIEDNKSTVKNIFEKLGYSINNISFHVDKSQNITSLPEEEKEKINMSRGFLDIKI